MSEEERIARRWFEQGWNERDESVVDELMAPDVAGHMAHGRVEGIDAFKQVRAAFLAAFPDLRLEVEEVLTAPGRAAVRWLFTGTHTGEGFELAPTGQPVRVRGTSWVHLRDGQIAAGWDTWDMGTLFARLREVAAE
jgi:steroid delta-isomerase-like uncharacterized protein